MLAVWLEPAPLPVRSSTVADLLHAGYLVYALAVIPTAWNHSGAGRLPRTTHAVDIGAFCLFQLMAPQGSAPLLVYTVFSLFCATLRWQWRGTVATALIVLPLFLALDGWTTVALIGR